MVAILEVYLGWIPNLCGQPPPRRNSVFVMSRVDVERKISELRRAGWIWLRCSLSDEPLEVGMVVLRQCR